jgi:eukaryotic-like serine/threonine-protein kinase
MMGQKPDAKLTPEIAWELCQRTGSAAVLDGSIAQIGTQYLLTLKAVNCVSGELLAGTESQASDKNQVLDALGRVASEIRNKLGESLSTVQKFDTPLQQATTPSLEALKAYSLARDVMVRKADNEGAVPLFEQAIHLDPNFAMAYTSLGACFSNLGEESLAAENIRKGYALRKRVAVRERFYIEAHYYESVMGDLEKARQTYELWRQVYPRDVVPSHNLALDDDVLGQYDAALIGFRDEVSREPSGLGYDELVNCYLFLNRLEEARAAAGAAQAKKLDNPGLHLGLYELAFLESDSSAMNQQIALLKSNPGEADMLLETEARTAAYSGELGKTRAFSNLAVASAERADEKETAASYEADAAFTEALFGNAAEARQLAASALGLSTGRLVEYGAALAFAGDTNRAESLGDDLSKRFPEDTIVQFNYLPTLYAQLALNAHDSAKAIEVLQAAAPYELGAGDFTLYPVYVRGEAYLAAHHGSEAAAEFQKILDHRGIVLNWPTGALAHLQIGRAYAMQGDGTKARSANEDFLTLWKDADPDIPILKQAKAEYVKLK